VKGGISLTVLGMVMMVLALLNFLHLRVNIDRNAFHPPVCFVLLLTILASLIGLLLVGYLLFTV
jgi:putative membrane protein